MKKKLKLAAGIAVVLFCILLGCEKRENSEELLFLDPDAKGQETELPGEDLITSGAESGEAFAKEGVETAAEALTAREMNEGSGQTGEESGRAAVSADGASEAEKGKCVVHICGAVKEPGVYTMEAGDRIYQAVERAGGFTGEASEDYLNQADLLADGMKVYIPTREEVENLGGSEEWVSSPGDGGEKEGAQAEGPAPVNINTADETQLCTLPGIGSSKAKSIIAYREKNGAYKSIEEIMNVEGIKEGMFQKIRDSITV